MDNHFVPELLPFTSAHGKVAAAVSPLEHPSRVIDDPDRFGRPAVGWRLLGHWGGGGYRGFRPSPASHRRAPVLQ
jgi:hypothetical protein